MKPEYTPTPRRRHPLAGLIGLALVAVGLLGLDPGSARGQPGPPPGTAPGGSPGSPFPSRRVLLLWAEPRLTPAVVTIDAIVRSTLESRSRVPVTFYTEYLDLTLFEGAVPLPELRHLLLRKYGGRPIDLIVAGGSRALRVALHNRAALFSGAPIVFIAVDPRAAADLRLEDDVTGTWLRQGWADTLGLAQRLQPDVRRAVVVSGVSSADRVWQAEARAQLPTSGPIEVTYVADLGLDEIVRRAGALPRHAVVLIGPFLRDGTGRDMSTPEAVRRIAAGASVPVYGLTDSALGAGVVGGQVVSFEAHGRVSAELALQVLDGARPPPTDEATTVPMFDARQLDRWGIERGRLPAGSRVLFDEPSAWQRYRGWVLGSAAVVLLQAGLIGALLVQRAQRRRAQESLTERLGFETLLSDLSGMLAAPSSVDDAPLHAALERVTLGLDVDWAVIGTLASPDGELRAAHAWTRPGLTPAPATLREAEMPEIFAALRRSEVVRLDGAARSPAPTDGHALAQLGARAAALVPLVRDSALVGCLMVGAVRVGRRWPEEWAARLQLLAAAFAHVLERRRATLADRQSQEAIRDLAGRLMTAQEEERRRIARDLHDDVNQELAAQSIALGTLPDRLPAGTSPAVHEEVARLQGRAVELARTIRDLSHTLHPGVLEHAGLVAALRGHCRSWEREHGIPVAFAADGEFGRVPQDVALCLYRATQEGLGNVARHAKAQQARVALARAGNDVVLTIGDDGRGFDHAEARRRRGLGLTSVEERVRLVGGRLSVESAPLRGTELRIAVPMAED